MLKEAVDLVLVIQLELQGQRGWWGGGGPRERKR